MVEEVIIADTAFDVPSDNYDEFDQDINPAKLGARLVQTNTLKGTIRQYQFYAPRYLLLSFVEKKKANAKKFRLDLASLQAEPDHNKIIVWKWLYGAFAAASLLGLCVYLALTEAVKQDYCIIAGTIALTTLLICILFFIYCMRDEYIFKSHFGNARLFLIENKKPDQQAFDSFFIHLQQAIDKTQAALSVADRLVGELKMCRRLRDEGIIDDNCYTIVRTAIFKHEQYKT